MQDHFAHVQCGDCPIRHRAVCARCDSDELAQLEQIKYYRSFQAGQTIIWSGDRMEFVGSFVGRPGRATAAFDVTATTDLVMCCFRKKPFETLIAETPHVAQRLLEMTLDELDAAREWMLLLGRKTAREKIASLISIIVRREAALTKHKKVGMLTVDLPLTREEMADYLGLTLETVSRQISALKKDGVISLEGNRHVSIPNIDRLLEEAGDDTDGGMLV
jgi:CRP/FNR family transcriptional regulator